MSRIITPVGMLSYPHLASPKADSKNVDKYSAAIVFGPDVDLTELKKAALEAAKQKFPGKNVEVMFAEGTLRSPFRKVTSEDVEKKGYPAGGTFINARSTDKPRCLTRYPDANGKPQFVPEDKVKDELYPGCQVKLSVSAFGYDRDGNRGVSFGLGNVQKWAEGTRLDNRKAAEDEFSADLSTAPVDLSNIL